MSMFDGLRGKQEQQFDDQRFDLLVDGALSESQRRKLLTSLDHQTGGWRHCALAFLENQCLKEAIKPLGDERATETAANALGAGLPTPPKSAAGPALGAGLPTAPNVAAVPPSLGTKRSRRTWPLGRIGTLLAMAASFLVAVYVGSLWQQARRGQGAGSQSAGGMLAVNPRLGLPASQLADSQLTTAPQRPVEVRQQPGAANGAWHTVAVSLPGGPQGQGQTIQLPAIDGGDKVDQSWLQNLPAALPADVLQALQHTGHVVQQQRQLVPLRMNDGRELIVPVDKVEVHYVGRPAY